MSQRGVLKENYLTALNHSEKVKNWMEELQIFSKHWKPWSSEECALLVIDAQRYFLDADSHAFVPAAPFVLGKVGEVLDYFRQKKLPVFFTYFATARGEEDPVKKWWEGSVEEGSSGAELSVEVVEGEPVIRKRAYSAFYDTDLEGMLKNKGLKKLLIAGVLSNLCCESTVRDAFDRGFEVYFLVDGTAAYNEAMHRGTLQNLSYGFSSPLCVQNILNYDL